MIPVRPGRYSPEFNLTTNESVVDIDHVNGVINKEILISNEADKQIYNNPTNNSIHWSQPKVEKAHNLNTEPDEVVEKSITTAS